MNGYEQILCQIPVEGYYLGYKCPVYGISITYSTYKLLKAMGVPIEPYDPKAEMEKQAKIVETIKEEIPQVKETVNVKVESTPVETISESKQKVIVEPSISTGFISILGFIYPNLETFQITFTTSETLINPS